MRESGAHTNGFVFAFRLAPLDATLGTQAEDDDRLGWGKRLASRSPKGL